MKNKILLFIIIFFIILIPVNVHATTLKEYEDQVAKYTQELREKEAKLAKNAEEIAQVKKNISIIEGQITAANNEIERLQREIEESNQKIIKKTEESKKVMQYYQIENGNNAYLEYAFGAKTITNMIYRVSIIEQLTAYNEQIMKELRQLIEENTRKKAELDNKKVELDTLTKNLEAEKARIEEESHKVEGTMPSTKGQIKQYQDLVNYYRNKGCKSSDVIGVTCAVPKRVTGGGSSNVAAGVIIGENGFRYPVTTGRISQGYGGSHKGVDIAASSGTPIYAVAAGTVFYVGNGLDLNHAYMVMIVHNVNGKMVFSQYAHVLANIPVRVGQDVDMNTVIGYVGSTGYSTGPHLHLEMSTGCGWGYLCSYYQYINHIINPFTYVPRP